MVGCAAPEVVVSVGALWLEPLLRPAPSCAAPSVEGAPCAGFVRTRGGSVLLDVDVVLLAARGVAWAAREVDAALDAARAGSGAPLLAHAASAPSGHSDAARLLAGRAALEARGVAFVAEAAPSVDDLGALTAELLHDGLWLVSDGRRGAGARPGRADVGPEEVPAAVAAHAAALRATATVDVSQLPARARQVHLVGDALVPDLRAWHRLIDSLDAHGLLLGEISWEAPAPGLLARMFRAAARQEVRAGLRPRLLGAARLMAGLRDSLGPAHEVGVAEAAAWGQWLREEAAPEQAEAVRLLDDVARAVAVREALAFHVPAGRRPEDDPRWSSVASWVGEGAQWPSWRLSLDALDEAEVCFVTTWQCELRCVYCTIPKQDGRVMDDPATVSRGLDLLFGVDARAFVAHFYGGEPFLNVPALRQLATEGRTRGEALGRPFQLKITTNGWSVTDALLEELAREPIFLQLSLDGAPETQRLSRRPWKGGDSYERSPARLAGIVHRLGIPYHVIKVIHAPTVDRLVEDVLHIASLGFRRLLINYALQVVWTPEQIRALSAALFRLGRVLLAGWADGSLELRLENLERPVEGVRTNFTVTLDHAGVVYGTNAFLYNPAEAKRATLGHLDDLRGYDRYVLDNFDPIEILDVTKRRRARSAALDAAAVMDAWVDWMRGQGATDPESWRARVARLSAAGVPRERLLPAGGAV